MFRIAYFVAALLAGLIQWPAQAHAETMPKALIGQSGMFE
jgi:hypothetical protein